MGRLFEYALALAAGFMDLGYVAMLWAAVHEFDRL